MIDRGEAIDVDAPKVARAQAQGRQAAGPAGAGDVAEEFRRGLGGGTHRCGGTAEIHIIGNCGRLLQPAVLLGRADDRGTVRDAGHQPARRQHRDGGEVHDVERTRLELIEFLLVGGHRLDRGVHRQGGEGLAVGPVDHRVVSDEQLAVHGAGNHAGGQGGLQTQLRVEHLGAHRHFRAVRNDHHRSLRRRTQRSHRHQSVRRQIETGHRVGGRAFGVIVVAAGRIGIAITGVFAAVGRQHRPVGGVDEADVDPLVAFLEDDAAALARRHPIDAALAIADGTERRELIGLDLGEAVAVKGVQDAALDIGDIDAVFRVVDGQVGHRTAHRHHPHHRVGAGVNDHHEGAVVGAAGRLGHSVNVGCADIGLGENVVEGEQFEAHRQSPGVRAGLEAHRALIDPGCHAGGVDAHLQ